MSEKRFKVIDDGFSKWIVDTTLTEDKHEGAIYTAYDMCHKLNELYEENEQLKKTNEKLQWELNKTREDLNYFANLKVSAMRGSDCGHDRCYVTSMQKKGD